MTEQPSITVITELGLPKELESRNFRNHFFRAEREIDIPAQIKNLRKLRNINQASLAKLVGTKQSSISRLERSLEAKWELETLVKLAEALDARLSVIIEPYENVIARYKNEQRANYASATTAGAEIAQKVSLRSLGARTDAGYQADKTSASNESSSHREQPAYLSHSVDPARRSAISS
ncbi:MAG: helix-turn-helix transcriptional regulator [Methylocella sp.]